MAGELDASAQHEWIEDDSNRPSGRASEGGFSCVTLVIGIICLVTAFSKGDRFCTGKAPNSLHQSGIENYSPLHLRDPHIFGETRRLLADDGIHSEHRTSPDRNSWTDQLTEEGNITSPSLSLDANATQTQNAFIGANGWVITWLKAEGFFAFAPISVTLLERVLTCCNFRVCVVAIVGFSAFFQTIWFVVGLVWIYGNYVPSACRGGDMGDNVAYNVMWWVCTAKLAFALLALPCFCLMVCCVYYSQKDSLLSYFESDSSLAAKGQYTPVDSHSQKATSAAASPGPHPYV